MLSQSFLSYLRNVMKLLRLPFSMWFLVLNNPFQFLALLRSLSTNKEAFRWIWVAISEFPVTIVSGRVVRILSGSSNIRRTPRWGWQLQGPNKINMSELYLKNWMLLYLWNYLFTLIHKILWRRNHYCILFVSFLCFQECKISFWLQLFKAATFFLGGNVYVLKSCRKGCLLQDIPLELNYF